MIVYVSVLVERLAFSVCGVARASKMRMLMPTNVKSAGVVATTEKAEFAYAKHLRTDWRLGGRSHNGKGRICVCEASAYRLKARHVGTSGGSLKV